ncbi:MAG TPA: YbdD/YjiX family protein [Chloroflexia bacterium]|nr:YbdD/YjiX family protein [Chloroflexia bacterium]
MDKVANFFKQVRFWSREYLGENEYQQYLADWKIKHAGMSAEEVEAHPLMTPRQFFDYRLAIKYNPKMSRC